MNSSEVHATYTASVELHNVFKGVAIAALEGQEAFVMSATCSFPLPFVACLNRDVFLWKRVALGGSC